MTVAGHTIAELVALPLTALAQTLRPSAELEDASAAWESSESGKAHLPRRAVQPGDVGRKTTT